MVSRVQMGTVIAHAVALVSRAVGLAEPGIGLFIVNTVATLAVTAAVCGRLYRNFKKGKLKADDAAIVVAEIALIGFVVVTNISVNYGYGRHQDTLSLSDAVKALELFWVNQICYKLGITFTKISCLLMYCRLIPKGPPNERFYHALNLTLGIVICSGIANTVVTIFECSPVKKSWDRSVDGTCIDLATFWLIGACLNMATYSIIWLLPGFWMRKLLISMTDKLGLAAVFFLSWTPIGVSIYRVTTLAGGKSKDATHETYKPTLWTAVELESLILITCLPFYRKYIVAFVGRAVNFLARVFVPGHQGFSPLQNSNVEFEMV